MNIKVLLIDDEPAIRKGLRNLIPWETYGFTICGEAGSAADGMEKIESLSPDLIMLDIRLPQKSGLELAAEAREGGFLGKIIILSGFSDFSYAKKAIEFGITAYLLKPIDEEELLEALEKVRSQLEEESYLYAYSNQSIRQAKQNFILDIITGKLTFQPDMKLYDLDFSPDSYQLILLYPMNSGFHDDTVKKIHDLSKLGGYIAENDGHYCLLLKGKKALFQFRIADKMTELYYAIGEIFHDMDSCSGQYRLLKKLYEERFFFLKDDNVLAVEMLSLELPEKLTAFDLIDYVEQIYTCITAGQIPQLTLLLHEMEEYFMIQRMPAGKTMRILITCYMQVITPILKKYPKTEGQIPGDDHFTNYVSSCASLHEIITYMEQIFLLTASRIHSISNDNIVRKVQNFLDMNYGKSTLRLETISDIFGYNSSYLGKIFTRETGQSFNSYLDKLRVEKAKILLTTDKRIYQIAEECGFHDVEYFTKKFKRYTGMTPSSYRLEKQAERSRNGC